MSSRSYYLMVIFCSSSLWYAVVSSISMPIWQNRSSSAFPACWTLPIEAFAFISRRSPPFWGQAGPSHMLPASLGFVQPGIGSDVLPKSVYSPFVGTYIPPSTSLPTFRNAPWLWSCPAPAFALSQFWDVQVLALFHGPRRSFVVSYLKVGRMC